MIALPQLARRICSASALAIATLTSASGTTPEHPTKLPRYEVQESPFGVWGLAIEYHTSIWNRLTLSHPSDEPFRVIAVHKNSPGHAAGVVFGDVVLAINGRKYDALPLREARDLFYYSDSRTAITLSISRPSTAARDFRLTLDSGKTWHKRTPAEFVFWSVFLRAPARTKLDLGGILKPTGYCGRLQWAHRTILLEERSPVGVALIEGKQEQIIPGRSWLILHDDGTYEVRATEP